MTMMARKRSMANYPGVRQFCLESNLCGELSLGSAIVAGEWVGAHERLGRNRPALRGFNSEKGGVMDRLKTLDAVFIDAEDEDRHTTMAIASTAIFEGPVPSQKEFLAYIAGRLPRAPLYRRKLRTVPFRLGRPVWVDDPNFDLGYHVRRTALPEPGGDKQLADLMARVMSQRLDRDHPLWEYWVVEGLAGGRWALISKVHHCMVDGVSGTDLYRVDLRTSPETFPPPAADDRTVGAEPSTASLAAQAVADMAILPVRQALALGRAAADSQSLAHAGDRHGARRREARADGPASRQVLAERADRRATAVRLGPRVSRRTSRRSKAGSAAR